MKFRGLVVAAVVVSAVGWSGRAVFSGDESSAEDKAMSPGEEHARLAKALVGDWTVRGKFYFSEPATETDGTATFKAIMGGRYVQQDFATNLMGKPFEGRGVMGHDNTTKQYQSSWIDNMGTGMMNSVGEETEKGKSWTFKGTHNDPSGPVATKEVMKVVSDKEFTFNLYRVEGGKESVLMELVYKRK
jgi:hypothetical protein